MDLDIDPFLSEGEEVQAIVLASSRPALLAKFVIARYWPFFREKEKFVLVATDRRWLVLESAQEKYRGALTLRGEFDRSLRVRASWVTRFNGFDRPYSIYPTQQDQIDAADASARR